MAENGDRLNRMDRQIEHLVRSAVRHDVEIQQLIGAIANLATLQNEFVDEVRAGFRTTEERFRETAERFRETDERMRHTDERLDALISTVDSLIRRQPPA